MSGEWMERDIIVMQFKFVVVARLYRVMFKDKQAD